MNHTILLAQQSSLAAIAATTTVMSPRSSSGSRTKSKTGCRTCKIRKIKCDELMPECRRCTSTGRKCDGYGIWGGVGRGGVTSSGTTDGYSDGRTAGVGGAGPYTDQHRHRPQPSSKNDHRAITSRTQLYLSPYSPPRTFSVYPANVLDADEKSHLEWFWCRTSKKLQGAFFSHAGNAVLFQASASELAVTHAMLALCAVHKGADTSTHLRHEESFALVQYNKAIKYLRPRLMAANDRMALRLSLISCIAFVQLEFFRGHYQMARSHLEHGLRMLDSFRLHALAESSSGKQHSRSFVDQWILRSFRGLYLQSTLFGQPPRRPWVVTEDPKHITEIATFSSTHQAREYMEHLLLRICRVNKAHLEQQYSTSPQSDGACAAECLSKQDLQHHVQSWKSVHDETLAQFRSTMNGLELFAHRLLDVYHTMAAVMVDTLFEPGETRFDRHTHHFVSIVQQTLGVRNMALTSGVRQKFFGSEEGLSHSIADLGTMAPLFYLALKCRVRGLRRQAIQLIAETPRKEGIWDASLVAQIANKVMDLEEAEAEADIRSLDGPDDNLLIVPDLPYEQIQPLPITRVPAPSASRRVADIEVLLPDGPWDGAILRCRYQDSPQCDTYLIEKLPIAP
ncbi:hypothetical protein Z517_10643 [Fonsecaea pedrosoi CBS 271.37]|uniref:Unplaced genomic scaffold supercont1.7, whole genome shotgun sequence n=1 Tax=Fonsecaea pedrosoi CBS 271.37 TaxID=1442368 RepID=A0A0D2G5D3_9EURO|nr:uncharacterized protein Z517_10643 [Fonsecaea pedrosoi CBS 271.37]KIW75898.1 hypothetical protein Z517_10643 [Fonsecaea pedrosoi CBS 271.37]